MNLDYANFDYYLLYFKKFSQIIVRSDQQEIRQASSILSLNLNLDI